MPTGISQQPQRGSTIGAMAKAGAIGAGVGAGAGLATHACVAKMALKVPKEEFISTIKDSLDPKKVQTAIDMLPDGWLKNFAQKRLNSGKLAGKAAQDSASFFVETVNKGKIAWSKLPKSAILKPALILGAVAAGITGLVCVIKKD